MSFILDAIQAGEYDERDIERMKTNDDYVSCFVKSGKTEGDAEKGVQLFHDVFTFRKQMNIWGKYFDLIRSFS